MSEMSFEDFVSKRFIQIQDERFPEVGTYEDVLKLSELDQTVLLINYFDGEVMNGGLENWLAFETGALIKETLLAMERVGAEISARVIRGVQDLFVDQPVSRDADERQRQLKFLSDSQRLRLDELSDLYCSVGREQDKLFERVFRYVEKNERPEEFRQE